MCRWASACGRKPDLWRQETGNRNAGRGSAAASGPTCFSPASGKRRNGSCRKESKLTGWVARRGAAIRCVFLLAASAVLVFAAGCYRATLPPKEEGAQPIAACGPSDASGTRVEGETAPSLPPPEPLATAGGAPSPPPPYPPPGGGARGARPAAPPRRRGEGEREGYCRESVGSRSGHCRAALGGGSGKDRRCHALGGEGVSAGRAVLDEREGRTRLQGGISGDQDGGRKVFLSGGGAFGREGGV